MDLKPKYEEGRKVYHINCEARRKTIVCPDCLGGGRWRAELPNGKIVNVDCPTCSYYYRADSEGELIGDYEVFGSVRELTIGSIGINTNEEPDKQISYMCVETGVGSGSIWYEKDFYDSRISADDGLAFAIEEKQSKLNVKLEKETSDKRAQSIGRNAAAHLRKIREAKKVIAAAEVALGRSKNEQTNDKK